MKIYTIYINSNNADNVRIKYIPESFSFWGFIFSTFWLLYHRIWAYALIFILLHIVIAQFFVAQLITYNIAMVINMVMHFYVGCYGNNLIRKNLVKHGYIFHDIIVASSNDEAELRFITQK